MNKTFFILSFAFQAHESFAEDKLAPGNCPQFLSGTAVIEESRQSGALDDPCQQLYNDIRATETSPKGYSNPSPCGASQLAIVEIAVSLCEKWEAKKNKK